MEQDSDFAGNSDNGSPPAFGLYEAYTPRFQAAPRNRSHEHRAGRGVEGRADTASPACEMRSGVFSPDWKCHGANPKWAPTVREHLETAWVINSIFEA